MGNFIDPKIEDELASENKYDLSERVEWMDEELVSKLHRLLQLLNNEYYRQETVEERTIVRREIDEVKKSLKMLHSEVVDYRLTKQWDYLRGNGISKI